ncbi:hypothetical protein CHLNCDRAFT_136057 [Chlorella variabilis]|uniref:Uncharacterized protein n=1 Tax=Chlorella variabilis TaxID=554065 RepID=E1ZJN3_CHLVA|nr:hypothetical protein CHLNCDRAFT_136057 [Chlorella variabilis]EFN54019.1 hypothetical protein CHLNCDRAFT_136057 [Chlorella variabilis]|eukprot:XP_005846121.1 hypothetical protein CHLNCDRAFT_136057 [Chlorella variabilis]
MQQQAGQQLPAPPPHAAPSQQPAGQLCQPGTWEERLRARLAGHSSAAVEGPFGAPAGNGVGPMNAAPGSAADFAVAATLEQPSPQQQPQQLDDTLSLLLGSFPPPAAAAGGRTDSDVQMLLNSAGSAGDSLLGSLLRAAGGQPGIDDLAAMLASL